MKKTTQLIITLVTISIAISAWTEMTNGRDLKLNHDVEANEVVDGKRTNCHIEVNNAALERKSKGFRNFNFLSVLVTARCNLFQDNVKVDLEIWKKGKYFNHRVAKLINDPTEGNVSGYVVSFRNLGVVCKSAKQTIYYGIASVSATIDQETMQTPKVISSTPITLPCGT